MSSTLTSNTTAYLTATQFVQRVDTNVVGEWLSDTTAALTSAQVLASTILTAFLKGSSGELESACLAGERYSAEDLTDLASASPTTNSTELLYDIVAGLTLGRCWGRRPRTSDQGFPTLTQWAQQQIELLRQGVRIFGFAEHAEAGRIKYGEITPAEVAARGLASYRARRMLGPRADQTPPN